MAQRTVCLCDGKHVGIETIFTVISGQQIIDKKGVAVIDTQKHY